MVIAQQIRDVQFSKSFSGYRTDEVDAFLDQCTATLEAYAAEKAENERKMQVLAESVVDYRKQEDSIRTALLNAQRMSEKVLQEANEKRDEIINAAKIEAGRIAEAARADLEKENEELRRLKREVAAFKSQLLSIYREHLTLIGVLSDETGEEAPKADEPASEATAVSQETDTVSNDFAEEVKITAEREEAPSAVKLDLSAFTLQEDE